MSLTLYGMGTGAVAGLAGSTNESAVGYILGSSGLDLYKYKLDREITALNNPAAYLTAKKDAVDLLINPTTIKTNINREAFRIGEMLGFPGKAAAAGNPGNADLYAPMASPFVRDLAANQVLEKLKQDLALIDVQYPNSIDEVAKKKRKKIIKNKISTGEDL